jgi:hypothetical protein
MDATLLSTLEKRGGPFDVEKLVYTSLEAEFYLTHF